MKCDNYLLRSTTHYLYIITIELTDKTVKTVKTTDKTVNVNVQSTAVLAGNDTFLKENITEDRKKFITQSKHTIFW